METKLTALLENYAAKANEQTKEHLRVWSDSVTGYAEVMNKAMSALSSIVDEIEDKTVTKS